MKSLTVLNEIIVVPVTRTIGTNRRSRWCLGGGGGRVSPFLKALIDVGIVAENCVRVVIDGRAGQAIRIHYEVLADERIGGTHWMRVFELG